MEFAFKNGDTIEKFKSVGRFHAVTLSDIKQKEKKNVDTITKRCEIKKKRKKEKRRIYYKAMCLNERIVRFNCGYNKLYPRVVQKKTKIIKIQIGDSLSPLLLLLFSARNVINL